MSFLLIVFTILITVIFGSILFVFLIFGVLPILRGAIFVPTSEKRIERSIELVNLTAGQKVADLGSGDGRIIIACAEKGAEAVGFEINPFLVWMAKRKIRKKGLNKKTSKGKAICELKSFWTQDFSSFDVIFIYGINYIMGGLEKKLKRELKPGGRVVSFIYKFPNWESDIEENGIYIYRK